MLITKKKFSCFLITLTAENTYVAHPPQLLLGKHVADLEARTFGDFLRLLTSGLGRRGPAPGSGGLKQVQKKKMSPRYSQKRFAPKNRHSDKSMLLTRHFLKILSASKSNFLIEHFKTKQKLE